MKNMNNVLLRSVIQCPNTTEGLRRLVFTVRH